MWENSAQAGKDNYNSWLLHLVQTKTTQAESSATIS